jgi:hypothetical protein
MRSYSTVKYLIKKQTQKFFEWTSFYTLMFKHKRIEHL